MFHFAVTRGEPGACFGGIVIKRSHAATIGDVAAFIDDINALGPSGIGGFSSVAHVVDAERHGIRKAFCEIVGDSHALRQSFWLRVANIFFYVGLHLPLVGGMRFAHVDSQKIGVIFIVVVDFYDVAQLATKGRSSVAAEKNYERARAGAFANMKMIAAVELQQARVGSFVADFEFSAMHMGQGITQHVECVFGASGHHGKHGEARDEQDSDTDEQPF